MNVRGRSLTKIENSLTFASGMAMIFYCFFLFTAYTEAVFAAPDTAWIARTGQYILGHGLPTADIFSWTCHWQSWTVYQWLFAAAVGGLFELGGLWLVGLGACIVAAFIYLFLLPAQMLKQGVRLPYVFGLLSLVMMPYWFLARPQLVSFVLIYIFINILERYRTGSSARILPLLPLLMVLWANCHSFWFLGLFIVFAYLVDALKNGPRQERQNLLWVLIASSLSVLINPYGWGLVSYNLSFLTEPDFGRILELKPWLLIDPATNKGILAYLAIAWMAIIARRNVVPLSGLILALAGTTAAFFVYRFAPVAVLFTWPYLGMVLASCEQTRQSLPASLISSRFLSALAAVVVLICASSFAIHYPKSQPVWFTYKDSNQAAIQFLKAHPELTKQMFSDADVGCSQILEGMLPVFIDTRFDMYGKEFCDQFADCMSAQPGWQAYLSKWNIATICIKTDCNLYRELKRSSAWLPVFDNQITSIWRANPTKSRQSESSLEAAPATAQIRLQAAIQSPTEHKSTPGIQAQIKGSNLPLSPTARLKACNTKYPPVKTPQ